MIIGYRGSIVCVAAYILSKTQSCNAYGVSPIGGSLRNEKVSQEAPLMVSERRRVFASIGSTLVAGLWAGQAKPAVAESDMATQMFNPDGSLKEEMDLEVKFRTVAYSWDPSDSLVIGKDGSSSATGSTVRLNYQLPEKWGSGSDDLYLDRSEGVNSRACDRIVVYQAPGKASIDRLEKASKTGIGKALDVIDELSDINRADLMSGKTVNKDGQRYFEFEMAVAPTTCGDSKENLGLGFCPYDSIYLLSSTILNERLYVFAVECDKSEWKRSSSDIRRLRSSFLVSEA